MAKIGYARVSTRGQKDDTQVDELNAYGVDKLFVDHGVSGKHAARPELDAALAYAREGDVLVITRLSRAMRSLKHLLALAEELRERGIGLVVLKQSIDTTTPTGRLVFHILGAIDEFQRELIVEGTREGLESARARGRVGGRKRKLSASQVAAVRTMYHAKGSDGRREYTVAQIAEAFNVSPADRLRGAEGLAEPNESPGDHASPGLLRVRVGAAWRCAVAVQRARYNRSAPHSRHTPVSSTAPEGCWHDRPLRRSISASASASCARTSVSSASASRRPSAAWS